MHGTHAAQQMPGLVDQWSYITEQGTQDKKYNVKIKGYTEMYQYSRIYDLHTINTDRHVKIYDLCTTRVPTYIDT